MRLARSHGGRVEHLLPDGQAVTVCGQDASRMARFRATERGQDAKPRPVCGACREGR